MVKLPTGEGRRRGRGTGKTDFAVDAIVSKEINQRVEVSGYGGLHLRAASRTRSTEPTAFRWGVGAGFPSRKPLRFTAELHGEQYSNDTLTTERRR